MQRRDALRTLATGLVLPGIEALAPGTAWATAQAIRERIRGIRQDQPFLVLTAHQDALVTALAERIIPETDTPGATAARVDRFVDVMLAEWFDRTEREAFLQGLADVDRRSTDRFGAGFLAAADGQQVALLRELDAEANDDAHFFRRMKWLTLYGYYTSEIGATREAHLMIVPGEYDGCAPAARRASGGAR